LAVLLGAGAIGWGYVMPVSAAPGHLVVPGSSVIPTIPPDRGGGGAFTVANENFGAAAAFVAARALAIDYVLNAAVAISADVGALVSRDIPHQS